MLLSGDMDPVGDYGKGVRKVYEMLRTAGLGVCVADGTPPALAAADRTCPPAAECGVAQLCRELWPEAFAEAGA